MPKYVPVSPENAFRLLVAPVQHHPNDAAREMGYVLSRELVNRREKKSMGVSQLQASRNRQFIVDTAARVFRERGVDGISVADLMQEAGFSHGGFYNHFESKEALASEACETTFAGSVKALHRKVASTTADAFRGYLKKYFSRAHRDNPGTSCPASSLAVDAGRQGGEMQMAYAQGVEAMLGEFEAHFSKDRRASRDPAHARSCALELMIHLVGAMTLARATAEARPKLSGEFLKTGHALSSC